MRYECNRTDRPRFALRRGGILQKANALGIKPIIGSELYVANERMDQKRTGIDDRRYHLVLLVKNAEGYKNLVTLITKSHLEGFYYKPRIDKKVLKKYSTGLIGLSACSEGEIPSAAIAGTWIKPKD